MALYVYNTYVDNLHRIVYEDRQINREERPRDKMRLPVAE